MRSKTRRSSYCTKRGNNTVNLVTSLARPIEQRYGLTNHSTMSCRPVKQKGHVPTENPDHILNQQGPVS